MAQGVQRHADDLLFGELVSPLALVNLNTPDELAATRQLMAAPDVASPAARSGTWDHAVMQTQLLDPLLTFRTALAGCFGHRRDARFDLVDALLMADDRSSLARLSLSPLHQRQRGSVYAALRRGQVHAEALRDLLARQLAFAGPPTFAVDVSVWPRPR